MPKLHPHIRKQLVDALVNAACLVLILAGMVLGVALLGGDI